MYLKGYCILIIRTEWILIWKTALSDTPFYSSLSLWECEEWVRIITIVKRSRHIGSLLFSDQNQSQMCYYWQHILFGHMRLTYFPWHKLRTTLNCNGKIKQTHPHFFVHHYQILSRYVFPAEIISATILLEFKCSCKD